MTDFLETDAYALFAPAERRTRLFLTCEHASNRLPEPYEWTPRDLESGITETHWAVDIGAETLTKELSHMLGARGIAARFCRLFCDANRAIGEETMFRASAENGQIVLDLNMDISESEKEYRVSKYYTPYHSTISAYVDSPAEPIDFVFSVHSFTPLYEGQKRVVEVGVLYRDEIDETVALKLCRSLHDAGFIARLNEPWSGMTALADSSTVHARAKVTSPGSPNPARSLLLEVRQDLVLEKAWRDKLVGVIKDVLMDPQEGLCI